jgi:hypothetical protein
VFFRLPQSSHYPEARIGSTRPRTVKSDGSPPVLLSSAQVIKAVSPSPGATIAAARALNRSPVVVVLTRNSGSSENLMNRVLALARLTG